MQFDAVLLQVFDNISNGSDWNFKGSDSIGTLIIILQQAVPLRVFCLIKACTFDPDYFLDPAKYKLKHFVQNTVEFSCLKSSVVPEQSFLQTKTDLSSFIQLNINIFKLPDN